MESNSNEDTTTARHTHEVGDTIAKNEDKDETMSLDPKVHEETAMMDNKQNGTKGIRKTETNDTDEPDTEDTDVDKGYAWIIVIGSFGIQFLTTGYARSNGVLFVAYQNEFQSTSSMTSVIMGIQEAVGSLVAFIFLGFVLSRTSPRFACLIGSACLFLGVGGNAFVNNAWLLVLTHGVCYGMALGLMYGTTLVALSYWFVKRRALATSLIMTGASAGGMVLPLVIRSVYDKYGFNGGFLLLGGIMLHSFIFSLLLVTKKRTPQQKTKLTTSRNTINQLPEDEEFITKDNGHKLVGDRKNRETECSADEIAESVDGREDERFLPASKAEKDHRLFSSDESVLQICGKGSQDPINRKNWSTTESHEIKNLSTLCTDNQHSKLTELGESGIEHERGLNLSSNVKRSRSGLFLDEQTPSLLSGFFHSTSTLHSLAELSYMRRDKRGISLSQIEPTKQQSDSGGFDNIKKLTQAIKRHPLTHSATFWMLVLFLSVSWIGHIISISFVPALAKERNLSADDGAFLASVLNLLDLPSRLIPGLIVNAGYMKASTVCIFPLFAVGLVSYFTTLMQSYQSLLVLVIIYGLFSGVYTSMQSLMVIEMVGLKLYPITLAFSYLAMSIGSTSFFPVAGALKDMTGSYSTTYYLLGSAEVLSVFILICLPIFKRLDKKRGIFD